METRLNKAAKVDSIKRLEEGRILSSVHVGKFSSITEMNEARLSKFHPGNRAGVSSYGEISSQVTAVSAVKNRDLANRASPPSHINILKFLQRKQW